MNIQEILTNAVAQQRAESLKDSPQLLLGELILKLEAIVDRDLPVVFDFMPASPEYVCSWRGSYNELAIVFGSEEKSGHSTLATLRAAVGKTYSGWKGGDFKMGKATPVWVVGESGYSGVEIAGEYKTLGIVDVRVDDGKIVIVTQEMGY